MIRVRDASRAARGSALLSLGALAVHQLRYMLAYGHQAGEALAHQGHAYLSDASGVVVALAMTTIVAAMLSGALAPGPRASGESPRAAFRRTAALYALVLAAIFCTQELTEGVVEAGHPSGPAAILANGGWFALPLSLIVGAVCSLTVLVLRGVDSSLVVDDQGPRRHHPPILAALPSGPALSPLSALNLGFGFARRPPPLRRTG